MVAIIVVIVCMLVIFACYLKIKKTKKRLNAKISFYKYFTEESIKLVENPEIGKPVKVFLGNIARALCNDNVAEKMVLHYTSENHKPNANDFKTVRPVLKEINKMNSKNKAAFAVTMYYYLMALSYACPKHGGEIRYELRGEIRSSDALIHTAVIVTNHIPEFKHSLALSA